MYEILSQLYFTLLEHPEISSHYFRGKQLLRKLDNSLSIVYILSNASERATRVNTVRQVFHDKYALTFKMITERKINESDNKQTFRAPNKF